MKTFNEMNPKHREVLINIQKSVPVEWTMAVTKRVPIAPVAKEIMERAVKDPDVSDEDKKQYQAVLDSGFFDKEIDEEQTDVAQLIDAYVEKEILKAVAIGKLPKLKRKRSFDMAVKRFNKLKTLYDNKKEK